MTKNPRRGAAIWEGHEKQAFAARDEEAPATAMRQPETYRSATLGDVMVTPLVVCVANS